MRVKLYRAEYRYEKMGKMVDTIRKREEKKVLREFNVGNRKASADPSLSL